MWVGCMGWVDGEFRILPLFDCRHGEKDEWKLREKGSFLDA